MRNLRWLTATRRACPTQPKLKGPRKWTYYCLYVILDIFSRQVVGWMVADCESASLAKKLIRESCDKQRIDRDQLILHADRGSSMKSKGGVATFKKRQQSD